MAEPMGGSAGDPGAPTINTKKHRWQPRLGGDDEDSGAPTINGRNIDGGPPVRQCCGSRSVHHQRKRRRWQAPWVVMPEIQERPP
jgi:hypothetical protein